LILVLVMLFTLSLSVAVGIICRANRTVMLFYQSFVMSMTFLSGGFTPAIGERLARFSGYAMNFWGAQGLLEMMTGTKNPGELHKSVLLLSLWALCALILALFLFRKEGYHE
jgi:ABC-2 type transport system permease protein